MTGPVTTATETAAPVTTAAVTTAPAHTIRIVSPKDDLARPLLEDLEREYDERYGIEVFGQPASVELNRYPAELFEAPRGTFLLLLEHGEPISGGAFMPHADDGTAEVKRVWTRADRRGEGLAKIVLDALEREAVTLGYTRIFLTTGPRQPEAVALYLKSGYTPRYDPELSADHVGVHPFDKLLVPNSGGDAAPTHDAEQDPRS